MGSSPTPWCNNGNQYNKKGPSHGISPSLASIITFMIVLVARYPVQARSAGEGSGRSLQRISRRRSRRTKRRDFPPRVDNNAGLAPLRPCLKTPFGHQKVPAKPFFARIFDNITHKNKNLLGSDPKGSEGLSGSDPEGDPEGGREGPEGLGKIMGFIVWKEM